MTAEIAILFAVLVAMAYLFFTEKLPVELTAFAGLVTLVLGGYLGAGEAFSGFASPAVITMLSIFFLSAALLRTGLADLVAARAHRLLGNREIPLIVTIMLVAGLLSSFMNNIAAAAVLMPAVTGLARHSGLSPSRLFMPLSFGAILGGTMTLVGTPPNILAAELVAERGLEPFAIFDFTPLGAILLASGIVYMVLVGRRFLPARALTSTEAPERDLAQIYRLHETLFSLRIPPGSKLDGLTLAQTRFGSALGVQVVGILRQGKKTLAPLANTVLRGGDVLLTEGSVNDIRELFRFQEVELQEAPPEELARATRNGFGISARVPPDSPHAGRTLRDIGFRARFGATVVAIRRDAETIEGSLAETALAEGDELLIVASAPSLKREELEREFSLTPLPEPGLKELADRLFLLRIPAGSRLVGATLGMSRLGELLGITVSAILREDEARVAVEPNEEFRAGDRLLVSGEASRIRNLVELGTVELQHDKLETRIESPDVGVVEMTLSPRSRASGRTFAELSFRERTGLQVLGIWREGHSLHRSLANVPLRFGDAYLLQGPWSKIRLLGSDPDYVVLSPAAQEPRRTAKAPFALGGLALMIALVVSGFQPIHVAAFTAATFVVLTRAITMEEAYRAVEWRAVFLVAAILPVGIAMERTGAAELIAHTVVRLAGPFGPHAVLAGMFILGSLLSQCLDGAPAVVLLTPVAMQTAGQLGLSPYPIMMGVSLAASAAYMTPFSHKANLLVMGAGGYRVVDYLRVGTPLTLVQLGLLVLLVPWFFPVR